MPAWRFAFIALSALVVPAAQARTVEIVAADSSAIVSLTLPLSRAFSGSERLFLNDRALNSPSEYLCDSLTGKITVLAQMTPGRDTIRLVYDEIPAWVRSSFGATVPEPSTPAGPPPAIPLPGRAGAGKAASSVRLSGAKSFRVESRSTGNSEFGQTLDLRISGNLSHNLEISGALSDRGYTPAYGTINSRLKEFDRLNLQLKSARFLSQVGDITLRDRFDYRDRQVTGASVAVQYPRWVMHGAAARPRGRFSSASLRGLDRFQGPYELRTDGHASAIVPNSEKVWLDGRPMTRGAEADYIIDYAAGQITFSASHPIDSRSRIEVDFEPLLTAYSGEYFSGGAGASTRDSTAFLEIVATREGDDRDRPLSSILDETTQSLLERAGDADTFRSGAVADSLGEYTLDPSRLPDTVYQYAGPGLGDYRVNFSYVGAGRGSYRFEGGTCYTFVGANAGDYSPVIRLLRPQRVDQFGAKGAVRLAKFANLTAGVRSTEADRNLFSSLNDDDNQGLYYEVGLGRGWSRFGAADSVAITRRVQEKTYASKERIRDIDFARTFLLPGDSVPSASEYYHRAASSFSLTPWLVIAPEFVHLDFTDQFTSRRGGSQVTLKPDSALQLDLGYYTLSSKLRGGALGTGDLSLWRSGAKYNIAQDWQTVLRGQYERRKHNYYDTLAGATTGEIIASLEGRREALAYEYFAEDSLLTDWTHQLTRHRITARSSRSFSRLSYATTLSHQWLDGALGSRNGFLFRTQLGYTDGKRDLRLNSAYALSRELKAARGISYLLVEPGTGNFRLEDGQYIPDIRGDYVQVEELLSERADVSRAEKQFVIDKRWPQLTVRLQSDIQEELLPEGNRSWLWLIPIYSDETEPYLYFSRRSNLTLRIGALSGFYLFNLEASQDREQRRITTDRVRDDRRGKITLKEGVGNTWFFDQSVELFQLNRDAYFSISGDVDGYRVVATVRRTLAAGNITLGPIFRRADGGGDSMSRLYALELGSQLFPVPRSDLRARLELYRQELTSTSAATQYLLTDNHPGNRGVIWDLAASYGVTKSLRARLSFTGRHADTRAADIMGRGELIAEF